jgi:hypothetical protein
MHVLTCVDRLTQRADHCLAHIADILAHYEKFRGHLIDPMFYVMNGEASKYFERQLLGSVRDAKNTLIRIP